MNHSDRRDRLRKLTKKSGVNSLLVTNFANVTYLTGFTGDDSYLLSDAQRRNAYHRSRYTDTGAKRSARASNCSFAAPASP